MKFKYNFYEKKLWRIEENYLYEVSEENRKIEHFAYRKVKVSFKLGANQWITFIPRDEWNCQITIGYTKPLKNGEVAYYEKQIKREPYGAIEIIIEFTEADRQRPKIEQRTPI